MTGGATIKTWTAAEAAWLRLRGWLSVGASSFVGGAVTWALANQAQLLAGGALSAASVKAFAVGATIAGLTGVLHLLQPSPAQLRQNTITTPETPTAKRDESGGGFGGGEP